MGTVLPPLTPWQASILMSKVIDGLKAGDLEKAGSSWGLVTTHLGIGAAQRLLRFGLVGTSLPTESVDWLKSISMEV